MRWQHNILKVDQSVFKMSRYLG